MTAAWPELPYESWKDTLDTLHLKLQVVGKVRLALSPFEPQWSNVPLYVTARGLTTMPMESNGTIFQADVDLIDHVVALQTTAGQGRRIPLGDGSVADFYHEFMANLDALEIDVKFRAVPDEVPDPIPFPEDEVHATYDPAWAARFFSVLARVDLVLKEHRARFNGRTTPVHFFWGSFDLACLRFSGRPADPPPDGDLIMRRSHDAEQVCVGWWPGSEVFPDPAFYSYTYPKPDGIEQAAVKPASARWDERLGGEFALLYEDARKSPSPRDAILQFCESTFEAGARLSGWPDELVVKSAVWSTPGH